jgi:uncharacterized phage protein (TIGR01671 family)
MREIKFRAYAGGVMVYFGIFDVRHTPNGITRINKPHYSVNDDNQTIMQFTGLHDKNGKEAYHKDVAVSKDKKKPTHWIVEFNDNEGIFYLKSYEGYEPLPLRMIKDMEFIGNIYENPELLESK